MEEALEGLKRGDYDNDAYVRMGAWDTIVNAISFPGDDPESDNMDYVCANDIMSAIARECNREVLDDNPLNSMSTATTMIGLSVRNADKVGTHMGMIKGLIRVCKDKVPDPCGAYALTSLTNLALHSVAHKSLLDAGGLQMVLGFLHYLDGETNNEMDIGLTSASFICRVVGKEESGPGPDAIKANSKLVEKLLWILTTVLDVGPQGRVIGYHWNPANILSDVATLATSDRNKPLLVDFVLQLVRALELRMDNRRGARLAIVALSQLSFEPRCKPKFEEYKERLTKCLDTVINTFPNEEIEAKRNAQVLKATVNEGDKQVLKDEKKKAGGALGFRRVAKAVLGASALTPSERQLAAAGHVMISYQWDSQPIAIEIEKRLRQAGIKTWFDLNDMGDNVNDSMAFAVEAAHAIIVLFCRKYKESGNCRKECEMGDNLQKNMIFVKVEPNYRQEAWLSLVMGKALWIDCPDVTAVDVAFPQITKRLSSTKLTGLPPVSSSPTSSTAARPSEATSDLGSTLKTMTAQMAEMRADIVSIKAIVQQLQQDVKALKKA